MKNEITEKLCVFPWFQELSPASQDDLLKTMRLAQFQPGQIIGSAGEQLNYLLAVTKGIIQNTHMSHERKFIVASNHGPGSLIGWLAAIDQKPLTGSLVAKNLVEVLLLPMAVVRETLLRSQPVANVLLTQMAAQIRQYEEERRILLLPNAFQRIYLHILNLSQSTSATKQEIRLPKQDEIAVHVNTSRETVSRAVQQLLKQGIITKQGHRIQLQQPELLKQLAESGPESVHNHMAEADRANV